MKGSFVPFQLGCPRAIYVQSASWCRNHTGIDVHIVRKCFHPNGTYNGMREFIRASNLSNVQCATSALIKVQI